MTKKIKGFYCIVSLENPKWTTIYKEKKIVARTIEGEKMAQKIIEALKHGGK